MTDDPNVEPSFPDVAAQDRPYPPSWVDHVIAGIQRLPGPSWMFYLLLWLALFLLANVVKWVDGSQAPGTIEPLWALRVVHGVYFLALMQYLNGAAGRALDRFRPALAVGEDAYARLRYQLTTLPAWPTLLTSAIGFVLAGASTLLEPAPSDYVTSPLAFAFDGASFVFFFTVLGAMLYHTYHQVTTVSHIHDAATRLDLFQPDPLYAFSGLTARTVAGYILIMDPTLLYMLEFMREEMTAPGTLGTLVVMSLLVTAAFFLPLLGMHHRMNEEKKRLKAEANQRLEATIARLHHGLDAGDLSEMVDLQRAMDSLEIERNALDTIPTWPWQPGTLGAVISALLFPVIVWSVQRLLEYLAGL